jgi:hypothetical protein
MDSHLDAVLGQNVSFESTTKMNPIYQYITGVIMRLMFQADSTTHLWKRGPMRW